ncbi:hypothetical protein J3F84DRAFT_319477 [Trichoderma pleuroticola]
MPSNGNFTTYLRNVMPGDITGDYYILFSNLPFKSTWRQVRDWVSASCNVDFVEVYPFSSSGWIRLKGRDNFMSAKTFMENEPFQDRCIIIECRNETESVNIRFRHTSAAAAAGFQLRSNRTRGDQGLSLAPRPSQSPNQGPMPQNRRTHSLAQTEADAVNVADTTPRRANEDVLALANYFIGMTLQSAMQMQNYGLPVALPPYGGGYYAMGNANTSAYYDGGHEEDEAVFADDASQSSY